MGITEGPRSQFHKETDQPENEKALGPISKRMAIVVTLPTLVNMSFLVDYWQGELAINDQRISVVHEAKFVYMVITLGHE